MVIKYYRKLLIGVFYRPLLLGCLLLKYHKLFCLFVCLFLKSENDFCGTVEVGGVYGMRSLANNSFPRIHNFRPSARFIHSQ